VATSPTDHRQTYDETPTPWARTEHESDTAYAAFKCYLELGSTRSIQAAADALGYKSRDWPGRWSSKHGWVDRALAYDEHLAALAFEAAADEHVRAARRAAVMQAEASLKAVEGWTEAFNTLREIAKSAKERPGARVRAACALLEISGFTPILPADIGTDASEQLVAELHRLATYLEPGERDIFYTLLDKATLRAEAEQQRGEAIEDEDEALD